MRFGELKIFVWNQMGTHSKENTGYTDKFCLAQITEYGDYEYLDKNLQPNSSAGNCWYDIATISGMLERIGSSKVCPHCGKLIQ